MFLQAIFSYFLFFPRYFPGIFSWIHLVQQQQQQCVPTRPIDRFLRIYKDLGHRRYHKILVTTTTTTIC